MFSWLTSLSQLKSDLQAHLHPLRTRLLNDPYYRFQSLEEIQLAATLGITIDVNRASIDDWLRLPGISIHQARSLATLTQAGVQFHGLDDIAAALCLPVQRLQGLVPILSFCYYDPASLCTIQPINANTASAEMLVRIPAIDLFLARAMVQTRHIGGPYRNVADLQQRLSLSSKLVSELMHYLSF